eukprot:m.29908 g.29908  ORF g.29908 m.29908 type:complete len:390 (-) comp12170_c0_seq2:42-1211(-)
MQMRAVMRLTDQVRALPWLAATCRGTRPLSTSSPSPSSSTAPPPRQGKSPRFVDKVAVLVRGGSGGQGSQKHGLPGGNGGDVIVETTRAADLAAMASMPSTLTAGTGGHAISHREGTRGDDIIIPVPVGTIISAEGGYRIADLDSEGQSQIVAYGGEGGSAVTNEYYNGLKGDSCRLVLELKSIADIGLVGFPNAGKSSLLTALSNSRPKIADYPFTTISPNIGTVVFDDLMTARMADIPGLIQGASQNHGMGHAFLKHIERTAILLFVVDITGFQLSQNSPRYTAIDALTLLLDELELYQPGLANRPALLAVNKVDLPGSRELYKEFQRELREVVIPRRNLSIKTVIPMSVHDGFGVAPIKVALRKLLEDQLQETPALQANFQNALFS